MARTDTLGNFLTDVCDAVREVTGETGTIKASELDTKIQNISSDNSDSVVSFSNFDSNGYPQKAVINENTNMSNLYSLFFCYGSTSGYSANGVQGYSKELTEIVLPNNTTIIPSRFARFNNKLTTINIPDTVTEVGEDAFFYCNSLKMTELPKQLTTIGRTAFSGCKDITELTIHENVTTIGVSAFQYCNGLEKVVIHTNSVPTGASYMFSSTPISRGTGYIYVLDNLVESFKTASNWSTYADQIKPISELETTE